MPKVWVVCTSSLLNSVAFVKSPHCLESKISYLDHNFWPLFLYFDFTKLATIGFELGSPGVGSEIDLVHASFCRQNRLRRKMICVKMFLFSVTQLGSSFNVTTTTRTMMMMPRLGQDETRLKNINFCTHKDPLIFKALAFDIWGSSFRLRED